MPTNDEISAQQIRIMRREFERAVQSVRDSVKISELQRLISANDIDGVINLLGLDRATFAPLENAMRDSYRLAGEIAAEVMSPIPVPDVGSVTMRFDMLAPSAVAWLQDNSSELITEISEQQREMVRERLAYYTGQGINPKTAALDLVGRIDRQTGKRTGGFIGLTTQQAQWVQNARSELESLDANYLTRELRDKRFDSVVGRAIESGKPIPARQVDAMITSLQNRTMKYRADTISRNEAINALRAGQQESIAQAVQKGKIDYQDVQKTWDATGDTRTRPDHLLMEGQTVALLQAFTFPDGSRAQYPGDGSLGAPAKQLIQCRCKVDWKIDFIGKALRMEGYR